MNTGKSVRCLSWRIMLSRRLKNLSLIISLLFFIGAPVISDSAERVKVVEGLIENVTVDYIVVHDQRFKISGVPLKDASGKNVSKDQLKIGRKVAISFKGNTITSILIYDENMVE